jgi:GNAT superfamily N-acetyltransferase
MASWTIEPLSRSHQRDVFRSGSPPLDAFLHSHVSQYEKRHLGRTYVAVRPGEPRVWGYYTLASGTVAFAHLPAKAAKKLPKHPVPVILLARLAVDETVHGQGLGKLLLEHALRQCLAIAESLGVHAVEVDAIDDSAKHFYAKYGFVSLEDDTRHLYLPIRDVQQAAQGPGQPGS